MPVEQNGCWSVEKLGNVRVLNRTSDRKIARRQDGNRTWVWLLLRFLTLSFGRLLVGAASVTMG